jgi:hypothetical protein
VGISRFCVLLLDRGNLAAQLFQLGIKRVRARQQFSEPCVSFCKLGFELLNLDQRLRRYG